MDVKEAIEYIEDAVDCFHDEHPLVVAVELVKSHVLHPQVQERNKWHPMDSAPRNGEHILVYSPTHSVRELYWCSKHECWCDPEELAAWFCNTHWMPLPEDPM